MKILVFPKAFNPYQELLYANLAKQGNFHCKYLTFRTTSNAFLNSLIFPFTLLRFRAQKYKIIHVHWLYEFSSISANTIISRMYFTLYVFCIFLYIKALGFVLIYTLHDVVTHDHLFINEKAITSMMVALSDHVIILSNTTFDSLSTGGIPYSKVKFSVIPHGKYDSSRASRMSSPKARRLLRLPQSKFVLLYFGIIRSYKGIVDALPVIKKIMLHSQMVFVLVGDCYDAQLKRKVQNLKKQFPTQMRVVLSYVSDKEAETYFAASDCVVLPYSAVTNSGSAILAASLKKPIIAPRIGSLQDFPSDAGVLYDPHHKDALETAINSAIENRSKLVCMGTQGYAYVHKMSWGDIARTTRYIYSRYVAEK